MFPLQSAYPCQPLPHVDGSPGLRVLWVDPTPCRSSAFLFFDCQAYQPKLEPAGSPKFLESLSIHATFLDPDRPSGISPYRFLCIDFRDVKHVVIWMCFRSYGPPCGLYGSLCTPHLTVASFGATLDMGGWLDLTQQGLAPCKTFQATLAY